MLPITGLFGQLLVQAHKLISILRVCYRFTIGFESTIYPINFAHLRSFVRLTTQIAFLKFHLGK